MRSWLGWLVPAERCPDAETRRRAHLTVQLSMVLVVTAVVYSLFYALVVRYLVGALVIAVGGTLAAATLAVLRAHPTLRALGHVLTAVLYLVIVGLLPTSGGLSSPVSPWLAMPPTFAALLLGRRASAGWAALCIATIAAFFAAERAGVVFPPAFAADWLRPITCASYAGLVGCSAVLVHVFEHIRERAQARAESAHAALSRLAYHDGLTGLANRARFLERVDAALARATADGEPTRVAVLLLDLDGFKTVNDSLGHAAGDALLAQVGPRLLNATRGSDTVGRLGGDEFAVLLDNVRHESDLAVVADRVVAALAAPFRIDGHEVRVGTSVGVARATVAPTADAPASDGNGARPPHADVILLLHDADVAMYRAKARGKGQWVRHEPGLVPGPRVAHENGRDHGHERRRDRGRAHLGRV